MSVAVPVSAQAGDRSSGAKGWLGIVMDEQSGGRVLIKEVMRESPAEKAGLRTGDHVVRVEGTQVRSARETAAAVGVHGAGTVVRLAVVRDGKQRVIPIRLEPFPSAERLLRIQHVGRPAPKLTGLRTAAGTAGPTLDDYKGKVLVVDFWASWCIACRATSAHLNGWHDRYGSRGLEVIGIAAEPSDGVALGTRRFGIRYATFADPDMETSAAYHVHELPSVMIIDRRGVVRDVATGFDPRRMRDMEGLVQRLMAEPAP